MDVYWSHYAKVMEYNRQRILLQNPHIQMSCYDVPTRPINNPYKRNSSIPTQRAYTQFNSPTPRSNNSQNGSRRAQKYQQSAPIIKSEIAQDTDVEMRDSSKDDKLEFVVDEGFMKFLEISMEHKMKRKKQLQAEKQRDQLKQEEELAKGTNLMGVKHKQRKEYKSQLYGQEALKIMAMENAMDASLNQQKDMNKPVFWPNIALNLKF